MVVLHVAIKTSLNIQKYTEAYACLNLSKQAQLKKTYEKEANIFSACDNHCLSKSKLTKHMKKNMVNSFVISNLVANPM